MKFAHLKMIVRVWLRGGLSTVISLVSLTLGLLCSTILLLFTVTEFRVADSLGTNPNTYVLESISSNFVNANYSNSVHRNISYIIGENYPEVKEYTIISSRASIWTGDEKVSDSDGFMIGATPEFATIVDMPMLEGSLADVLGSSDKIALTRSYANKLFPNETPMGKQLQGAVYQPNSPDLKEYTLTVAAIIDDSNPTFLRCRAIYSIKDEEFQSPGQSGSYSAIYTLGEGVSVEEFTEKLNSDTRIAGYANPTKVRFTTLSETYFANGSPYTLFKSRDRSTILIGLTISLVVLLIAALNYLNLALTRAARRLKNFAGQRIMGASKWSVRWQIALDTVLNVVIAFGVALLFMAPSLVAFNSFMGSSLSLSDLFSYDNIFFLISILLLLIGLPAINLMVKFSSGDPLTVFKNPRGGSAHTMRNLTIVQLVVSVALVAFSLNISNQMGYITTSVADAQNILTLVDNSGEGLSKEFIDRLKSSSSTLSVTPGGLRPNRTAKDVDEFFFRWQEDIEPNFFDFFGVKILSGRLFDSLYYDGSSGVIPVVVNESYVRKKSIQGEPVGQEVLFKSIPKRNVSIKFRIVGVCEDFIYENASTEIAPTVFMMRNGSKKYWTLNLKFRGDVERKKEELLALYADISPEKMTPTVQTMEQQIEQKNSEAVRLQTIVEFFMLVSLFLTAFGLFGLSWYTVERRRKEIAVRKVYGGSVARLIALLCSSFMVWTLIAVAVALPVGYFISDYWLNGFVHHIDNSIWTLILTALIAALLTFVTVIFQTASVALSNPAKYIKSE